MRRIIICGAGLRLKNTAASTAIHTYKASSDTPRGSVLGFTLLACLSIQLLSGFFVTSTVFESSEAQHFIGLVHRAIPLFFVAVLCAHVLRAFSSSSVAGFAALKSGGVVLVFITAALGTGYILAAAGEAGYWGAVISVFNICLFLVDFLFKAILSVGILFGISFGLNTDTLHATLIGSTTVSPLVFYYIVFFVHLIAGVLLF